MEKIVQNQDDVIINISGNVATISHPILGSGNHAADQNARKSVTVSIQTLMKSFKSFVLNTSSPLLPLNCIKFKENGSYITLALYHPPQKFTAIYDNGGRMEQFENCIRPAMVVTYKLSVRSGIYSISDTYAYAVKVTDALFIDEKTELLRPPFPNINDNGGVCWGRVNRGSDIHEFKSLVGLRFYIDRLFNSPFNSDLFNSILLSENGINNPRDLFTRIQGLEEFPENLLMKLYERKTIGGL